MKKGILTPLGLFLSRKPLSQAKLARMTRISKDRISKLHIDPKARVTIEEGYLIALALEIDITDIVKHICEGIELAPKDEWDVTAGNHSL